MLIPLFYKPSQQALEVQLTAQEFEKLTGAKWIQKNCWGEGVTFPSKRKSQPEENWFLQTCQNFIERPQETFTLAAASSQYKEAGLGLFARRKYQPFEIIGEYLGEYSHTTEGQYTIAYEPHCGINAQKYANALSRINDSFPNLFLKYVVDEQDTTPFHFFLITLQEIEPGEQLCFNYGSHEVKKGPHIELNGEKVRTFAQKYTIEDWQRMMKKMDLLHAEKFHLEQDSSFIVQFHYLLQTPTTLFELIADGTLSYQRGKELFSEAIRGKHLPVEYYKQIVSLPGIAKKWHDHYRGLAEAQALLATKPLIDVLKL